MNLNGWIIYNGNLPGDKFIDFAEMFHDAARRKSISTTIYKNNELIVHLTSSEVEIMRAGEQELPDFVIFTDKDIYLAKQLELLGVRVFNSARTIDVSDDKIATYQYLAKKKLPIPKTIVGPKTYTNATKIDDNLIDNIIDELQLPMVIKEAYGSFGEQVYLVHTKEELKQKVIEVNNRPFVFQEFISSSYGKDLRLQVVGDEVVASMLRTSVNDFRANVTAGGTMHKYTPTEMEEEMAIAATKAIDADFAGVDLLFGSDGNPIICEVNSNAHIRNMYDCTGINAAENIIDYIVDTMKKEDV